jgi:DNA replication licensing factor MCM4
MIVLAYYSLVDAVKPGDRVEITGVYRAQGRRPNPKKRTLNALYHTHIDALHFRRIDSRKVEVTDASRSAEQVAIDDATAKARRDAATSTSLAVANHDSGSASGMTESLVSPDVVVEKERELIELSRNPDIYDILTRSLAPSVWGMDDVKKGILCMLFGGTNSEGAGSGKFRGEINILLCGDPGTSKSQLLQYVHSVAPRGVYTSGKGSSAVGLTAHIARDPATREMVLESGAIVLSDRGILCLDEMDKMNDTTRSILHEAMEQQTVSIAKAGIVCTLNARTAILASANPKQSRYNPKLSVVQNIELGPTLLSRFDLIYLVLDQPDETSDRRLANHIISMYLPKDGPNASNNPANISQELFKIPTETLMHYISYSRRHCRPEISEVAAEALVEAYADLRNQGNAQNRKTITATPRQLESLMRLSEALAKMRFASIVEKSDVDEAVRLMNVATQTAATNPLTGEIDMDLLTTGQSSSDRQIIEMLVENLGSLFLQDNHGLNGIISIDDYVRNMNVNSTTNTSITSDQMKRALVQLQNDGRVELSNDRMSFKVKSH